MAQHFVGKAILPISASETAVRTLGTERSFCQSACEKSACACWEGSCMPSCSAASMP
ncbi:hypothetical protein MBENS4_4240 [Novosphingobium sp. MBES04]|nr:hypothetical protein MBENS4_4240 [Novosphingobium sp. MBES04]